MSDAFWDDIKAQQDRKEAIELIRKYLGYDNSDMTKEEIEEYVRQKWNRSVKSLIHAYFDF